MKKRSGRRAEVDMPTTRSFLDAFKPVEPISNHECPEFESYEIHHTSRGIFDRLRLKVGDSQTKVIIVHTWDEILDRVQTEVDEAAERAKGDPESYAHTAKELLTALRQAVAVGEDARMIAAQGVDFGVHLERMRVEPHEPDVVLGRNRRQLASKGGKSRSKLTDATLQQLGLTRDKLRAMFDEEHRKGIKRDAAAVRLAATLSRQHPDPKWTVGGKTIIRFLFPKRDNA